MNFFYKVIITAKGGICMRLPKHIGVIPDGNRRWAMNNGMTKEKGYNSGLDPGLEVFKLCEKYGIEELTFYGFTIDNTKRPKFQRLAFTKACIDAVEMLAKENADLLVIGNYESDMFPKKLLPYIERKRFGTGGTKVNFLVNYDWKWDVCDTVAGIKSRDISRVDLIIRWGGRRRLSGFLPLQSVYSDFYIIDEYWPDFKPEQFEKAMEWYQEQDITLGG